MKMLATLLFLLLIYMQISLWFGSHGIFQLWSLEANIAREQDTNRKLMQRNEQLHAQVQELKDGREALEERARSQLGFIKEGEKFYRVIPEKKKPAP